MLGGGFLIELLLMVVALPFFATGRADVLSIVIVPATLFVAIPCGAWAARVTAAPLLNGTLAGVAAFAICRRYRARRSCSRRRDQADLSDQCSHPPISARYLCKVLGAARSAGWWMARRGQKP